MKKNTTRRALFMSILSLMLCVAMLMGTTFAWFTDSVVSGNNKIIAGNLDVEMYYANTPDGTYTSVVGAGDVFVTPVGQTKGLWEPGHTEVTYLKIKNEGTLALKYQLQVTPVTETVGENADGGDVRLSEILKFSATYPTNTAPVAYTRETAQAAAVAGDGTPLTEYTSKTVSMAAGEEQYIALVVYMPEEVGNEANYRGDTVPSIEFGLSLLAIQTEAEIDSFGNDYDAGLSPEVVYVASVGDLRTAMKTPGAKIAINDDLVIDSLGSGYSLYAKYDAQIDLNGHDIIVNVPDEEFYGVIYALGGAKVDIVGEGNIKINGGIGQFIWCTGASGETEVNIYGGNWIQDSDDFTLEGSNYCEGIYANRAGKINIYGGTFNWKGFEKYTVNESREGVVTVYGGTFINFDPRVSHDGDGSYVAEGYTVVTETHGADTWYTVVKK